MNENLNLVEILKDCPKGTKLYSTVFGEVEFDYIENDSSNPINVKSSYGIRYNFTIGGELYFIYNGECTLFPSREQRDWSKFTAPWYKKEGDTIACLEKQRDKDKLIQELGEYKVKYTQEVLEKYINSMSNKDDERLRKTAIAFLKDFAEQGYENAVECIDWLEKQGKQASPQTNERAWLYFVSDVLTWKDGIGQYLDDPRVQELAKRLCSKYAQKLYNTPVLSNSSNTGKNEQKSSGEIEPKFKVGNWYQCTKDFFGKGINRCLCLGDNLNYIYKQL